MADISKCKGDDCAIRETCLRYIVEAGERQSWVLPDPATIDNCDYHWPVASSYTKPIGPKPPDTEKEVT